MNINSILAETKREAERGMRRSGLLRGVSIRSVIADRERAIKAPIFGGHAHWHDDAARKKGSQTYLVECFPEAERVRAKITRIGYQCDEELKRKAILSYQKSLIDEAVALEGKRKRKAADSLMLRALAIETRLVNSRLMRGLYDDLFSEGKV